MELRADLVGRIEDSRGSADEPGPLARRARRIDRAHEARGAEAPGHQQAASGATELGGGPGVEFALPDTPTDMELSAEVRERIRLEEQYRHDIRSTLDPAKRTNIFWSFLNSSFGLWLLSAIFVSGAGAAFTLWNNAARESRENLAALERLDIEISYRFSQVLSKMNEVHDLERRHDAAKKELEQIEASMASPFALVSDAERQKEFTIRQTINNLEERMQTLADPTPLLTVPPNGAYPELYPVYADYSLPSLMTELRRLAPEKDRAALDRAIAEITSVRFRKRQPSLSATATAILEKLVLPRWKQSYFDYVDCPPLEPFC